VKWGDKGATDAGALLAAAEVCLETFYVPGKRSCSLPNSLKTCFVAEEKERESQ
jgi:hypothetical protein